MRTGDGISMSNNAVDSVMAALSAPREETPEEKAYDAAEENAVVIPGGHVEKPSVYPNAVRLYSLTTIAASRRYGGTRTVMICDSFERACEALAKGPMFWWEHSYAFAVIEVIYANNPYGGMCDRDQYWFRFNWDKSAPPGEYPDARYEAIEKPTHFERFGEFAVG